MTVQPASSTISNPSGALLQRVDLPHDDLPKTFGPARPVRSACGKRCGRRESHWTLSGERGLTGLSIDKGHPQPLPRGVSERRSECCGMAFADFVST
ncbi:hypothetical protein GGP72_001078 [Salinibacter ruber]|uniref:Uncharacterized protein n=1 Tax=Salinibacter ruber TaxID=146919 RepID=A0A9X2TG52_9BACT|nr:hypothetical protein [Salinibacter ruber]MCS3680449.1 hypothetical protein [Salinibacter ruber]